MKKQVTGDFWIPIDKDDLESNDGKEYLRVLPSLKFHSSLDNDKLDRLIELLEMFRDYRNDEELNVIFQLGNTHCSVEFRQGLKIGKGFQVELPFSAVKENFSQRVVHGTMLFGWRKTTLWCVR